MKQTICSLYVRVSTSDKNQTVENQIAPLLEYAKNKGYEIYKVYSDEMSGKKANRPGFLQMLKDAKDKQYNHLLFYSLSRLGRRGVLETLEDLRKLDNCGCTWESMSQPYLSTIGFMRDAVIGILSAIANEEVVQRSNNVQLGLSRTANNGTLLGTRSCLPYEEIRSMRECGKTLDYIAKQYGVSAVSVYNLLNKKVKNVLTKKDYGKYYQTEHKQVLIVNYVDSNRNEYKKTYTAELNTPAEIIFKKAENNIYVFENIKK